MDPNYSRYSDFLKDRKFLRWQLMPDEELEVYWRNFMTKHHEHVHDVERAILFLKKEGLNKGILTVHDREALLESIQKAIRREKKAKQKKLFVYASVASVAVILVAIVILFLSPSSDDIIAPDRELIVGELLSSEDIQLITSDETISFRNDVDVSLDSNGMAEITESNNETSKIAIAKDKLNSLVIPYGKRSSLTLSDGSKVWLNSGSVLEFPSQFRGSKREIHLVSGEMYIEVVPDKNRPFQVQTSGFNVDVHGTRFNITNYSGSSKSVVLVEGSVSLQSSGVEKLVLEPSQQAVFSGDGTFNTETVDINQYISWKDGFLTFNKTPMSEVLRQIGRYYNLSFDLDKDVNLLQRTCTGKIYLSDNLDNVMTTIALLSSTNYEKLENKIHITNQQE